MKHFLVIMFRAFHNKIYPVLHQLTDMIFPDSCLVCDEMVGAKEKSICADCRAQFRPFGVSNWISGLTISTTLDAVYSGWFMDEEIQTVIHTFKYMDRAKLGYELGRNLGKMVNKSRVGDLDVLVPVPLHAVKLRERGYNQSEWVAKGLGEEWDLPVDGRLLKRQKYTESQTKLHREDRIRNMDNAFQGNPSAANLTIGLVDDVITTGSTLAACASALKAVNVSKVVGISCCTPDVARANREN